MKVRRAWRSDSKEHGTPARSTQRSESPLEANSDRNSWPLPTAWRRPWPPLSTDPFRPVLRLTRSGRPGHTVGRQRPAGGRSSTGTRVICFNRSIYDPASGSGAGNPRQQLNEITAYIDASNVYGSDAARASALRTNDGSGELLTSDGRMLPFNEDGLANAGGTLRSFYLAGDIRANENVALLAMHTLWAREHNRQARLIRHASPGLEGDGIYARARARVIGLVQAITYNEFLPRLLGGRAVGRYQGWDRRADAGICTEFSTAAFRFGHSMVSPRLLRLRHDGLRDADRLFYKRAFKGTHLAEIEATTLADVIRPNTRIEGEIAADVFTSR